MKDAQFSTNFLSYLLESIWIRYPDECVFLHFIQDAFFIQLQFYVVMSVEIKFVRKGQIRRYFQVTGAAQNRVMEVNLVLLDRFVALVQHLMFFLLFLL